MLARAPIVIDLPAPPSVNRTRRIDRSYGRKYQGWTKQADALVLASRCRSRNPETARKIASPFEVTIILSDAHTRIDCDNGVKATIDYLRRIELIEDDGPRHMRRLIVEYGHAPAGCRVTLRELPA